MNAGIYEECGECAHYPAYCKTSGCAGWDPDQPDGKCACSGRKPPKVKPVVFVLEPEHYWEG